MTLPPLPTIDPDENPERRYQYTRADLDAFRERLQSEKDKGTAAGGGFGGFGGGVAKYDLGKCG